MLSVGFQGKSNIYFNNRNIVATNNIKSQNNIAFKGNIAADAFVLARDVASDARKVELKRTADVLRALGVRKLTIGNNLDLARLLESVVGRVEQLGYDVPARVKCEAKKFRNNKRLQEVINKAYPEKSCKSEDTPGLVSWDTEIIKEPTIYFNTKFDWDGKGDLRLENYKRFMMGHEIGHWLHMKNYGNDPALLKELSAVRLDSFQELIIKTALGRFRADNPVPETVADIFGWLSLGMPYSEIHPLLRDIYQQYRGPMPRFKASNASL